MCRRTGRQCLGYKDYSSLIFRYFAPIASHHLLAYPYTSHSVVNIAKWETLDFFVRNFVVQPSDERNSRGFLHGLQEMIRSVPGSSDLVRAVSAVSIACKGNCDGDLAALTHAAEEYGETLRSFRGMLLRNTTVWSPQTLITAVILGLYEVSCSSAALTELVKAESHMKRSKDCEYRSYACIKPERPRPRSMCLDSRNSFNTANFRRC